MSEELLQTSWSTKQVMQSKYIMCFKLNFMGNQFPENLLIDSLITPLFRIQYSFLV